MTRTSPSPMHEIPLYRLAHSRAGDKGDISCLSVIAYDPEHYDLLVQTVTPERVADWFATRRPTAVRRYVLPRLQALNLVLEGVLDGGVNGALNLDTHGKGLSFHLLAMPIPVPAGLAQALAGPPSAAPPGSHHDSSP